MEKRILCILAVTIITITWSCTVSAEQLYITVIHLPDTEKTNELFYILEDYEYNYFKENTEQFPAVFVRARISYRYRDKQDVTLVFVKRLHDGRFATPSGPMTEKEFESAIREKLPSDYEDVPRYYLTNDREKRRSIRTIYSFMKVTYTFDTVTRLNHKENEIRLDPSVIGRARVEYLYIKVSEIAEIYCWNK